MEEPLTSFADVFPNELPKGLPPSRPYDHRILLLKDSIPSRHCRYRVPLTQKEELKRQIDELLASGHIERAQSPFGAGVLFVEKHDKTLRLCVDYRRLNAITVKDVYRTPRVDDSIDKMKHARFSRKWICAPDSTKSDRSTGCPQDSVPNGMGLVSVASHAILAHECP